MCSEHRFTLHYCAQWSCRVHVRLARRPLLLCEEILLRLTPKNVGDVLEAVLGWRIAMTPLGFEWRNDLLVPERVRLQRGSGIAGRGDIWALVRLPDGVPIVAGISTQARLKRAVLEFMAGPPPLPLSDYTIPRAKRVLHPRTRGSRFVWYRRKKRQPGARVMLVPFGAAHR
jgi:hypothetical protein